MSNYQKKSITLISHTFPLESDTSYGIFITDEIKLLNKVVDYSIIVPTPLFKNKSFRKDKFSPEVVKYISIPRKKFPFLTGLFLFMSLIYRIQKAKNKLIHVHWIFPSGLLIPILNMCGYKTVLTIHGGDWYQNYTQKSFKYLIKKIFERVDSIITVSSNLRKDIVKEFPDHAKKITAISHAIDLSIFHANQDKKILRRELGFEEHTKHILCVANLYPLKGLDVLLNSLVNYSNSKNWHLHLVSPRIDIEYYKEIEGFFSTLENSGCITRYSTLDKNHLSQLYQACDLFVLPSIKEGFGIVLLEALACGLPCVSTKSGGPENIITKSTGVLCKPGMPDDLASSIDYMLKNLDKYKSSKLNEYVKENFSEEAKTDSLITIYDQVLND